MEERGGMGEEEEWLGEVKRGDGWSGEMFEWENIEEGEEEEWLGEVKRRDGWSGEMFDWENMESEEEEWGVVRERDNEGSTSTHMMINLNNVPTRLI